MKKAIIDKIVKLTSQEDAKVEVIAELAPQTNSMMYSDYFVVTTVEKSYNYVRGYVKKDSVCLKTRSLFVEVPRPDRNDTVSILCDLDNLFIINIKGS